MKNFDKMSFKPLRLTLLLVALMIIPAMTFISLAAQPTVNLGTTANFAVLAGSTITNTGTSIINGSVGGDVGLYPGTVFTGQADVEISGTVHLADDVAELAKADLVTAYDDAAGRTPVTRIPTELGGTTLTPGTYDSADGTFQITGTLTLDAQGDPDGVFVFKTASTLITASNSNVKLINSARFCRTFWAVGSSATLGTNSHFVGHIFAMTSITANTGATVQGQLLARNGAVTLDSNTITNGICETDNIDDNNNNNGGDNSRILISMTKTANPQALTAGPGSVTYTYQVSNPGTEELSDVRVSDDKLSTVNYVSGDINGDEQLQIDETWVYTGRMYLQSTTTNTATAKGTANGTTVDDTARVKVLVTQPIAVVEAEVTTPPVIVDQPVVIAAENTATTVNGGQLPQTATPMYAVLLFGTMLTGIGVAGWINRKRSE